MQSSIMRCWADDPHSRHDECSGGWEGAGEWPTQEQDGYGWTGSQQTRVKDGPDEKRFVIVYSCQISTYGIRCSLTNVNVNLPPISVSRKYDKGQQTWFDCHWTTEGVVGGKYIQYPVTFIQLTVSPQSVRHRFDWSLMISTCSLTIIVLSRALSLINSCLWQ